MLGQNVSLYYANSTDHNVHSFDDHLQGSKVSFMELNINIETNHFPALHEQTTSYNTRVSLSYLLIIYLLAFALSTSAKSQ